jgi:Tfp pilus assembly protein PilF
MLALKLGDLNGAENQFKAELANDPNYQTAIAEMARCGTTRNGGPMRRTNWQSPEP